MYNGIGLLTPRGSGTSGYVQTNKFNLRGPPPQQRAQDLRDAPDSSQAYKKPDQGILDHNRRREIELKVVQMGDALEEQGYSVEEIEQETALLRKQLEEEGLKQRIDKPATETHEIAERKMKELEKLRDAWGIDKDVVEGQAFDRELQEQKKLERIAEREAKEKERKAKAKELEKQRAKEEKRRAKEAKKKAKAEKEEAERLRKEGEERVRRLEDARAERRKRQAEEDDDPRAGKRREAEPASQDAGAERWEPRPPTPEAEEAVVADADEAADPEAARQTSGDGPSTGILSPTPSIARSRPPSPSPAKLRAEAKAPPPPRAPSPPRNGRPQKSPPARVRSRRDSLSPPRRRPAATHRDADGSPRRREYRTSDRNPRRDRDERRYDNGRDRDDRKERGRDRELGRGRQADREQYRRRGRSPSPTVRRDRAGKAEGESKAVSERASRRDAAPPRAQKSPSPSESGTSSSGSGSSSSSGSSGSNSSGTTSSSSSGSGSDSD